MTTEATTQPSATTTTAIVEEPKKELAVVPTLVDESLEHKQHIVPGEIVWEGDVPAGYVIESTGGKVTIKGNVGKGARVTSKYGLTIHGNAEEKSSLLAHNGVIDLHNAMDGVVIKSTQLLVKLKNARDAVKIDAGMYIKAEGNIGADCEINAEEWVSAKTIGARSKIIGKRGVTADTIFQDAVITAEQGKVTAKIIGERAKIRAGYDITIENFADESADILSGDRGNVLERGRRRVNKATAAIPQQPSMPTGAVAISVAIDPGTVIDTLGVRIGSQGAVVTTTTRPTAIDVAPTKSLYTASSPATFTSPRKESKVSAVSEPLKLPSVDELNKILGIDGLVTSVEMGHPSVHTALSISFNMDIDPNRYESTLKEKLLAGTSSNTELSRCSVFIKLCVSDEGSDYQRFMHNYESALSAKQAFVPK